MGIRMKKCKYCGNELNGTSEFCCNECESNYKEALEKDSRKTKYFILGIALTQSPHQEAQTSITRVLPLCCLRMSSKATWFPSVDNNFSDKASFENEFFCACEQEKLITAKRKTNILFIF